MTSRPEKNLEEAMVPLELEASKPRRMDPCYQVITGANSLTPAQIGRFWDKSFPHGTRLLFCFAHSSCSAPSPLIL